MKIVATSDCYMYTCTQYIYVVVQFYPWFKFYFRLFFTHYHPLTPSRTKGNKI